MTNDEKTGYTLIVDNLRFHRAEEVRNLVESSKRQILLFLPPYSLFLNPIENVSDKLKCHVEENDQDHLMKFR